MSSPKPNLIHQLLDSVSPVSSRELPFVSVVTPTWNRAAFLPYLIYMFRYQDYPAERRELVILDDSPQSHQPIIDRLTGNQAVALNIRYLHHPQRLTLGKKRNMLNELAQGEYIVCMDDDDYYPADKISYTIGMMQRHGALISGSDQIPIWYSHINRIFKTHRFGDNHILNGTFCYHRNYLKKHRYDDECNLGEEVGFTQNFSVTPLQLPGERTILCVSHSHNTFDKDFVMGSSEAQEKSLEEWVSDPMLSAWYRSLHNASFSQPLHWQAVDKVLVINLDKREDRWQQLQQDLASLQLPAEKLVRLSASEDETGSRGRCASWLAALQQAQQLGWENSLIVEDDVAMLRQQKHIQVINQLLGSLSALPWQAVVLGGLIKEGRPLKSLNGIIQAGDNEKVCALLVNRHYYPALIAALENSDSPLLEARWKALAQADKWLAFSPSVCYQRPGFSDIAGKKTDNIQFYFNRVNKNFKAEELQASQPPIANRLGNKIGFFVESALHWPLYEPVIRALQDAGHTCELLINDLLPQADLDAAMAAVLQQKLPGLLGSPLTETRNREQQYGCLVSTGWSSLLKGTAYVHLRLMAGLSQPDWDHAAWNDEYAQILCPASWSAQALKQETSSLVVGNPRFDAVFPFPQEALKRDVKKATLVWAPSFEKDGTLEKWLQPLSRLHQEFNLVVVFPHSVMAYVRDAKQCARLKKTFRLTLEDPALTLALLREKVTVLTDNRTMLFDALQCGCPVVALQPETSEGITGVPVAHDMLSLREAMATPFSLDEEGRRLYCDAFMDGGAGKRAAEAITTSLAQHTFTDETFQSARRAQS